ncbi:hypothetical protein ABPG74_016981 [Tetrahymena malaccensis]
MSEEVIQNFEIRDVQQMFVPYSYADEDRQLLAFLAGTQYAYGKVQKNLLSSLIAKVAQLFQLSQQNGQNEIKQTLFGSLINNSQQEPISYVEELQKSIEEQINREKNAEENQNQDKKYILDEEKAEEEQEQKKIQDSNIGESNQIDCQENETQQKNSLQSSEIKNQENKSILENQNEEVEEQKIAAESKEKLIQVENKSIEEQKRNIFENIQLNNQNLPPILSDESDEEEEEEEESKDMYDQKGQLKLIKLELKGPKYNDDLENSNYVCKLCYDSTDSEEFFFAECNHIFHQQCIAQYLNDQISQENISLKCPHTDCYYQIPQTNLKEILNQEQFEIYQQISLSAFFSNNDLQLQKCPNKECQFAFLNEDHLSLFDCPSCKKIYCLACNCLYHVNQTCDEHQSELRVQQTQNTLQAQGGKENLPFQNNQIQSEKISTTLNKLNNSDQDKQQSMSIESKKILNEQIPSSISQINQQGDEIDWDCEICCENMISQEYLPLICDHIFHKNCLAQYFNTQISEKKFPIKCPSSNCVIPIQQQDLQEVLSFSEFQKYEKFCLQNYIDSNQDEISWCPTPNCEFAFILEDGQYTLKCPLCKKSYCLSCKCDYHQGQTCQEYKISNNFSEDDKKLEQLAIGLKFKKCSKCKMWVEKNQGCDHMTCRCGYQFCYKCGGVYLKCECTQQQYPFMNFNQRYDNFDIMDDQPNFNLFNDRVRNRKRQSLFGNNNGQFNQQFIPIQQNNSLQAQNIGNAAGFQSRNQQSFQGFQNVNLLKQNRNREYKGNQQNQNLKQQNNLNLPQLNNFNLPQLNNLNFTQQLNSTQQQLQQQQLPTNNNFLSFNEFVQRQQNQTNQVQNNFIRSQDQIINSLNQSQLFPNYQQQIPLNYSNRDNNQIKRQYQGQNQQNEGSFNQTLNNYQNLNLNASMNQNLITNQNRTSNTFNQNIQQNLANDPFIQTQNTQNMMSIQDIQKQ